MVSINPPRLYVERRLYEIPSRPGYPGCEGIRACLYAEFYGPFPAVGVTYPHFWIGAATVLVQEPVGRTRGHRSATNPVRQIEFRYISGVVPQHWRALVNRGHLGVQFRRRVDVQRGNGDEN